MNLQQIADEAMVYLDSVGVAADYEINYMHMRVFTDDHTFSCAYDDDFDEFRLKVMREYPDKKALA